MLYVVTACRPFDGAEGYLTRTLDVSPKCGPEHVHTAGSLIDTMRDAEMHGYTHLTVKVLAEITSPVPESQLMILRGRRLVATKTPPRSAMDHASILLAEYHKHGIRGVETMTSP